MEFSGLLIVVATAAFLLPLLGQRLALPAVVLEILFGILVGPSVLGVVEQTELLDFLADLGFLLLMFLAGFEIDFTKLKRQGTADLVTALVAFAVTLVLAYISVQLLGYGFILTFVLATTSVGLVVPTIRSARLESSKFGQIVLMSAIIADFLTLLGVTVFAVVQGQGGGSELLNIPVLFIAIALVLLALRRAAWWFPHRFERLFSDDDPEELGIRASLALMLVFVGLSVILDIEPILGAFLAGTVFALVFRHRGQLDQKLTGFSYGFLIPIFFINVGIDFNLQGILAPGVLRQTVALIGLAVLAKLIPSLLFVARGLSVKEALATGTLLASHLSLSIAVAELGVGLGLITDRLESMIILLALTTTMTTPAIFRRLAPPISPLANAGR